MAALDKKTSKIIGGFGFTTGSGYQYVGDLFYLEIILQYVMQQI